MRLAGNRMFSAIFCPSFGSGFMNSVGRRLPWTPGRSVPNLERELTPDAYVRTIPRRSGADLSDPVFGIPRDLRYVVVLGAPLRPAQRQRGVFSTGSIVRESSVVRMRTDLVRARHHSNVAASVNRLRRRIPGDGAETAALGFSISHGGTRDYRRCALLGHRRDPSKDTHCHQWTVDPRE